MAVEHVHAWHRGDTGRTIILLHGTGGTEHDLIPIARALDDQANLLGIRGRSLDEGYPRFFRRLEEGVFDVEDLKQKTNELADFLLDCSSRYRFDVSQTVAIGYSNGANVAAATLLLRPDALQHGILLRAMLPLSAPASDHLVGHRVLLNSGSHDRMAPMASAHELAETLKSGGAEVTHHLFQVGHELTRFDLDKASQWIAELT